MSKNNTDLKPVHTHTEFDGCGCLIALIFAASLPCLAIWYFGMLSIILSFAVIALMICSLLCIIDGEYPFASFICFVMAMSIAHWIYTIHYP